MKQVGRGLPLGRGETVGNELQIVHRSMDINLSWNPFGQHRLVMSLNQDKLTQKQDFYTVQISYKYIYLVDFQNSKGQERITWAETLSTET